MVLSIMYLGLSHATVEVAFIIYGYQKQLQNCPCFPPFLASILFFIKHEDKDFKGNSFLRSALSRKQKATRNKILLSIY